MRGESMKDKSKKSTYSTTFGIDPKKQTSPLGMAKSIKWWPDQESNQGHKDFQSSALPTELSGRF